MEFRDDYKTFVKICKAKEKGYFSFKEFKEKCNPINFVYDNRFFYKYKTLNKYYSFKEFKENYNTDFENWNEVYPDADEKDFLNEVFDLYKPYFSFSGGLSIELKRDYIPVYNNFEEELYSVSISEAFQILIELNWKDTIVAIVEREEEEDMYNTNIPTREILEIILKRDKINNKELYQEIYGDEIESYKINDDFLDEIAPFVNIVYNGLYGLLEFKLDKIKHKNFQLSIPKICNFIEERRNQIEKEKNYTPELYEADSSLVTSKSTAIRLLHYTGILDYLREKYPNASDSSLARFFEEITKEPITHKNQNKQFYKDSNDSQAYKNDLDLILSKLYMI